MSVNYRYKKSVEGILADLLFLCSMFCSYFDYLGSIVVEYDLIRKWVALAT